MTDAPPLDADDVSSDPGTIVTIARDDDDDNPAAALRLAAEWFDTHPDVYARHIDVWNQDEMGFWGVTVYLQGALPEETP